MYILSLFNQPFYFYDNYLLIIPLTGTGSSLNVHAPVFASKISNHNLNINLYSSQPIAYNGGSQIIQNSVPIVNYNTHDLPSLNSRTVLQTPQSYINGPVSQHTFDTYNSSLRYCDSPKTLNGDVQSRNQPAQVFAPASTFKLNPTVSCFVPSNFQNQIVSSSPDSTVTEQNGNFSETPAKETFEVEETESLVNEVSDLQIKQNGVEQKEEDPKEDETHITLMPTKPEPPPPAVPSVPRSWADIVSRGQSSNKTQNPTNKSVSSNGSKAVKVPVKLQEPEILSLDEDKLALVLGSK